MTLIIAGERSGVGKTTITLAILAFLSEQGYKVQSFKVGPDYIDPMFHATVTGRPCYNLDPVLTSEAYISYCFAQHCQGADYALVEGVMGLFDGIEQEKLLLSPNRKSSEVGELSLSDYASTAHIARLLNLPVLLVLDCSRLSSSVAALAHGYCTFDPRVKIAGLVLNKVGSDRHLELLENALAPLDLPILGKLHREDRVAIPDRHLGLIPTAEISQLNNLVEQLAELGKNCFNWERLLTLLKINQHSKIILKNLQLSTSLKSKVIQNFPTKIAIARDRAFSFYYQDNLDILEKLGAQLIPWSPLEDNELPKGIQGLYFGGGFPEVFAQHLAENHPIRAQIKAAIVRGMPTYAECGGLMYLCNQIVDFEDRTWPMVGVLPTDSFMSKRLIIGYRQATALQTSPLIEAGEIVWGHEFHRSQLTSASVISLWKMRKLKQQSLPFSEGWQRYQVHASYLHLHFGIRIHIAARFLGNCCRYRSD